MILVIECPIIGLAFAKKLSFIDQAHLDYSEVRISLINFKKNQFLFQKNFV